ncbi:hypothetical protein [Desulfospira joergensenii]|uniref:hypothetical protein n=1 Tax=Desulfospira joergensenii TaxID=53329 RepID=UPI0003B42224|nr:hypothetical protein [Desulfospira joergensenii]
MKKTIALCCMFLVFPLNAFALFGAGDIVSDVKGYTYYVEMLKLSTKELDKLKKQLETAESALEETKEMRNLMEGTYNHAIGTISDLQSFVQDLKNSPTELQKYAESYLDSILEGEGGGGDWISAEDILKEIFDDPRLTKDQIEQLEDLNDKFHMRQKSLDQAINQAESVHASMPERIAKIKELAEKIDVEEKGTKYALDLNNLVLVEILKAINDLISLTAYIGEAQSMVNFEGVSDEAMKQFQKDMETNKKTISDYQPMKAYLDEKGINTNDSARKAMKDIRNKYRK